MGATIARASWASSWLLDNATEGAVRFGELREGLGNIHFIAGPIEYIRAFLGPLYAWASIGSRWAKPRLPVMIVLILRHLAEELRCINVVPCEKHSEHIGEVFRLDAKAEGEVVSIGSWRTKGSKTTRDAAWFSVQLTRTTTTAPWAFAWGEPFRAIAFLELLGALVSLVVVVPEGDARGDRAGTLSLSCGTDNRGNSYLLDNMITTKYPLVVILMELAHQMRRRMLTLRAHWFPRDQNEEADALTNFDYRHFDPAKRVEVDLAKLEFGVLNELFSCGEEYIGQLEVERAAARKRAQRTKGNPERKLRPEERLKVTQPWT